MFEGIKGWIGMKIKVNERLGIEIIEWVGILRVEGWEDGKCS